MSLKGFAGGVLYIDLRRRQIRREPLDPALAEAFIGGLGLTIKLAYDRIKPGTDALLPDNPLVFGAGPLVGTTLPATSRVYGVTKLPATGTIGWCGGGGANFGCMLKNAGYDHVVIEGRADRPVFLKIIDHDVEICEAGHLWGKGVEASCEALWGAMGRPLGVISIGQAGENLVSCSMAYVDRFSTIGRGGLGAVMGSKNLKAIVARGSRGVRVADRRTYKILSKALLKKIREYPYLKECQDLGLIKSLPLVPKETYDEIKKRRVACVSCPIGDKDVVEIPDGDFKGLVACSSSVVNLMTPMIHGMEDYRDAIKLVATLDEYGLDMFEFLGVMGFAKVLSEEGIIPSNLVDTEISLDSVKSMEVWARKMSLREGLGRILADGFGGIVREFGEEATRLAPAIVKGMFPYVGPKATLAWNLLGTMELGQIMDPRGPHVGASGSPTYFARRPLEVFPGHLTRMGAPEEAIERILPALGSGEKREVLKVGALLRYSHSWFSILGSLGICARAQINRFYNASLCADLYEAVTGIKTDLDGLRLRVDRVWTLLRMANLREGLAGKEEALPDQWFEQPPFRDYLTEEPVRREDVERMIEDYYREWGWDPKTGTPTEAVLEKLGLN
jgi:aldehyde:ferredoxin oxidoreductase